MPAPTMPRPFRMLPISFEFYPPKTDEQRLQLDRSVQKLKAHAPQFMSVTFGAGGSTLSHTPETVQRLRSEHGVSGVPHITCVGGSREEIRQLLKLYRALGCDRVVALLRAGGVERTLVDLGEARALGAHPSGRPWRAALGDPEAPGATWGEVDLTDRALASSGDFGFVFDHTGRFTHLLDPRSGRSPRLHRAVSVLAPEATLADGLSTGFALMTEDAISEALLGLDGVEVCLQRHDGSVARFGAA